MTEQAGSGGPRHTGSRADAVREGYREAARVVRARAGNFYFAFAGQPPPARRALHAIYAFCREADDASDDGHAPESARRALGEMRSRLAMVYEGSPASPRDRALQHAVRAYGMERRHFEAVLDGVERDLTQRRYATFDDLYAYCFEVASSVGLLCLPVFGRRDALARRHAIDLGIGMQLTNILRDLAEDGLRDRVYVPQEDLRRFGLGEETLVGTPGRAAERARDVGTAFDALVGFEAARARSFLRSGSRLLPLLPPRSRFCPAALAAIYGDLLETIEESGRRVLLRRVELSAWRKAWLSVRAYVAALRPRQR